MKRIVLGVLLFACTLLAAAQGVPYAIGAYYFPGWKNNQIGAAYAEPWEKIKPFPAREPMLGWYEEGTPSVMAQQLEWMKQNGLTFVAFNWYWAKDNQPMLAHALLAYLDLPTTHQMRFAVSWANHTDYTFSKVQFESMFRYWAKNYMSRSDYLQVDGRPVVFIFSAERLQVNARRIGLSLNDLFNLAGGIFKESGLPPPAFVGGAGGAQPELDYSASSGWDGFSAYNFHNGVTLRFAGNRAQTHSYAELDAAYQDQWRWFLQKTDGLYVVPMTSGWDKRPWGGSKDPKHDDALSSPEQFEAHLKAAKKVMDNFPRRTRGIGVICCWNEFGEGSFIEPTKQDGFSHLEKVKKVFGSP